VLSPRHPVGHPQPGDPPVARHRSDGHRCHRRPPSWMRGACPSTLPRLPASLCQPPGTEPPLAPGSPPTRRETPAGSKTASQSCCQGRGTLAGGDRQRQRRSYTGRCSHHPSKCEIQNWFWQNGLSPAPEVQRRWVLPAGKMLQNPVGLRCSSPHARLREQELHPCHAPLQQHPPLQGTPGTAPSWGLGTREGLSHRWRGCVPSSAPRRAQRQRPSTASPSQHPPTRLSSITPYPRWKPHFHLAPVPTTTRVSRDVTLLAGGESNTCVIFPHGKKPINHIFPIKKKRNPKAEHLRGFGCTSGEMSFSTTTGSPPRSTPGPKEAPPAPEKHPQPQRLGGRTGLLNRWFI